MKVVKNIHYVCDVINYDVKGRYKLSDLSTTKGKSIISVSQQVQVGHQAFLICQQSELQTQIS